MSKKKLSISLLVSGREETTKKCLDSIRPLLEQLDAELILVDTGCGPQMKEELRAYTDQIVPFTWCGDFAKARNAGLEKATGEWFMYLDDDEWFEDVTPIIEFFRSEESRDYGIVFYRQRNYGDRCGNSYSDFWVGRIFRLTGEVRFRGRIHEAPEPICGRSTRIDAYVHHYGYLFDTEEERQQHFKRNSEPLLQMIQEEPEYPKWRFQMMQEYQVMRMGNQLQSLAQESAQLYQGKLTRYQLLLRDGCRCAELAGLRIQKKPKELLAAAQSYLEQEEHTDAGRCGLTSYAAQAAYETGSYEQCAGYCRQYLEFYKKCRSSERDEQDQIVEDTILFLEPEIAPEKYRRVCMLLCGSLSREDRADEVPKDCWESAVEYLKTRINGDAEFLKKVDEFWETGVNGKLLLEDMILNLELAQWMAQVVVLERNRQWETWRGLCAHLRKLQTKVDIRYLYFYNSYYHAIVTQRGISGWSYEAVRRFFQDMAASFLDYAHAVYTERAFEGQMELLPKHVVAAVHIDQMLRLDEADIAGQKRCITEAEQAWSAFAPVAEHYGKLLEQRGSHPLLSIAVMASNRRDTIEKCLDSLTVIRETIPCELIVLDTGCSGQLHETLAEYADKIDCFTWCSDFSAARNRTIEMAEGEWYLFLDDDEWFVDTQELLDFFTSGEYREYDCASYIQRNFLDMQGTQYTDAWVSRVVRLTPDVHFAGRIHEYFAGKGNNGKALRAVVHHFGYVFESEEAQKKHYERNRTLLLEMMEEEPDNLRWYIQLVLEYRGVNEFQKLYDLGVRGLEKLKGHNDAVDNIYLGSFYAAKITALKAWERWEDGLEECKNARSDKRNTPLFAAFAAHKMTGFAYQLGDYDGVETYAKDFFAIYDFYQNNEAMLFMHKATALVGECFDDVMIKEVYSELILSGLKCGNSDNLLKYIDFLEWDKPNAYLFEDMVPTLLELEKAMADDPGFERLFEVMTKNTALMEYYLEQKTLMEKRKMSGPIKEQLRLLIANGMMEQAKQLLPSILEMLPEDDEELKEIAKSLEEA